jgi:hypothetical protein
MLRKMISMYLVYIVYFLGVGMTSSGIVLMPFNPVRYSIILATGLFLFSTGTFINEFIIDRKQISFAKSLKLIIVSLTLAIGIGMISGGISHFKESPTYASYLIPLGFLISIISFFIKNTYKLTETQLRSFIIGVIITTIVLFGSLSIAAHNYLDKGNAKMGGDVFMDMHE